MQAFWISLKEAVNCGAKLSDVVSRPRTGGKIRSFTSEKDNHLDDELVSCPIGQLNNMQTWFYDLNTEDPSRNVVEMIFQRASINPSNPSSKILTVLRVNNSVQILESFEKYREQVKKKAYKQYNRHPRSTVDGYELLRFYGTTVACCSTGKCKQESELCKDPGCGACRIIEFKFETDYTRRNGIQLSSSSDRYLSDKTTVVNNVKRAVIVCRIIAGNIVNNNLVDGEYDQGPISNLEYLIIRNSSAVLPCFVVVFD